MQTHELQPIFEKKQSELSELQKAIALIEKQCSALKSTVHEYNELMQERKKLRKSAAQMQKEMKIVASFFEGTTIFDERFPLFSQPQNQEPA